MALFFVCTLILLIFVKESQLVIDGATYGLMLWYKNLLPMLLPFMLVSGILVRQTQKIRIKDDKPPKKYAIFITFFIGLLCGYPLGAKTCSDFITGNTYDKRAGNLILAMCNNSSPMFISGYIAHRILNNSLPFFNILMYIYLPYIFIIFIQLILNKYKKNIITKQSHTSNALTSPVDINEYLINTITQITLVGLYVMLCSILIELIINIPSLPADIKLILEGLFEITRGTMDIFNNDEFCLKTKTALIIAFTSFGGISSILQTKAVIHKSGLSIINYITIKSICALLTYALCILFI